MALLAALGSDRLTALAASDEITARVRAASDDLRRYLRDPQWYQGQTTTSGGELPRAIAYFSAEFGLTSVLPMYSGGLGILAGDHLKSASA